MSRIIGYIAPVPAKKFHGRRWIALASILPSPRRWSPMSERTFMARRRTRLYARMRRAGFLPAASTALSVPDEIQEMANQANVYLQYQEAEENPLRLPTEDPEAASEMNDEGLLIPGHAPAPESKSEPALNPAQSDPGN